MIHQFVAPLSSLRIASATSKVASRKYIFLLNEAHAERICTVQNRAFFALNKSYFSSVAVTSTGGEHLWRRFLRKLLAGIRCHEEEKYFANLMRMDRGQRVSNGNAFDEETTIPPVCGVTD